MAGLIIFQDESYIPDNHTEVHFFEDDCELIKFSMAHCQRKHLVLAVSDECWHRASNPVAPTPAEKPASPPWKCYICGEPVRIADDLMPRHIRDDFQRTHAAKLSPQDLAILADGLRLTD